MIAAGANDTCVGIVISSFHEEDEDDDDDDDDDAAATCFCCCDGSDASAVGDAGLSCVGDAGLSCDVDDCGVMVSFIALSSDSSFLCFFSFLYSLIVTFLVTVTVQLYAFPP